MKWISLSCALYLSAAQASAESPPLPILARVSDFVAPFFSSAITVRSEDADPSSNPTSPVVRFVAALLGANRFLANAANKACATRAIAAESQLSLTVAAAEYAAATNGTSGETAQVDFQPSQLGILNVIDVRMLSNGFTGAGPTFDLADAIVPGDGKLLDLRVRDAAVKLVKELPRGSCRLTRAA